MNKQDIFRKNLFLIHYLFGWSREEFADLVGLTRQTLYNIEKNESYSFTRANYYAMKYVIDRELPNQPIEVIKKYEELCEKVSDIKVDYFPISTYRKRIQKELGL